MALYLFLCFMEVVIILYLVFVSIVDIAYICLCALLGFTTAGIFLVRFALQNNRNLYKAWVNDESKTNVEFDHEYKFKPLAIAHRTLALECPENSLSGIRQAALHGFKAVEFDVRFSSDDVPILFHDAFIDRVTNSCGKVKDLTFDELQLLDISERHLLHKSYENEKIPSLTEAITECLSLNLKMIIDVKVPNAKMVNTLSEIFKSHENLHTQTMVVSVSPLFIYKFKRQNPTVMTGLVWRPKLLSMNCPNGNLEHGSPKYKEKWKQILAWAGDPFVDYFYDGLLFYTSSADVFLCHRDALNKEYVRIRDRKGAPVLAWPVNNPIEKTYCLSVLKVGYLTDTHLPFL